MKDKKESLLEIAIPPPIKARHPFLWTCKRIDPTEDLEGMKQSALAITSSEEKPPIPNEGLPPNEGRGII